MYICKLERDEKKITHYIINERKKFYLINKNIYIIINLEIIHQQYKILYNYLAAQNFTYSTGIRFSNCMHMSRICMQLPLCGDNKYILCFGK